MSSIRATLLVSLLPFLSVIGQKEMDALRFSRSDVWGTARFTAMGGAFTALGGDASGSALNPAGLAVFRNNEFSLSGTYSLNGSTANYYNQNTLSSDQDISIGSFHLAGVHLIQSPGKWRSTAISFGSNQINSYNQSFTFNGSDIPLSKLDVYTRFLNENAIDASAFDMDNTPYPFDLYPAWYHYLIDTIPGTGNQYYNAGGYMPVQQSVSVTRSGSKRETFVNVAANYDDRLYIGMGMSIINVNNREQIAYSETINSADTSTTLEEFSEISKERIDGAGVSLTLGAIYRPIDPIRVGFRIRSGEQLNVETEYESTTIATFNGVTESVSSPVISRYKYKINSPATATLGVAYTFRKLGLISIESDLVDYRWMNMRGRTDSDPFTEENRSIQKYFKISPNVRTGAEYRISPLVSVRLGYGHYGNPFVKALQADASFNLYSFGIGYRTDEFFIDGSYQLRSQRDTLYAYNSSQLEPASIQHIDHRVTISAGIRF